MEKKLNFEQLNQLDPLRLVDDESVRANFIRTYSRIHGKTEADATMVCEREAMYYKKAVSADQKLKECSRLSLYSVFLEIAISGLSIQPGSKSEAYLEARGVKTGGTKENPTYTQTAYLRITAYGELNLRIMAGQIVRMMNPVVIYEGDHFQPTTNDRGELIVKYEPRIPRQSKKIIGCWVRIQLPDGSSDFKWLLEDDYDRLKKYATTQTRNGSYTNPLYSSENGGIDPGFLEAKTIKHAMRSYTKLRIGENVAFDDEPNVDDSENKQPFGEPNQQPQASKATVEINSDEPF
jgi:hypothetical protein